MYFNKDSVISASSSPMFLRPHNPSNSTITKIAFTLAPVSLMSWVAAFNEPPLAV